MTNQLKAITEDHMKKGLDALKRELGKVRTGKAQLTMLDPVKVNYYGTLSPLSQIAALSTPDAKTFMIAPWEVNQLKEIVSAVKNNDSWLVNFTYQDDPETVFVIELESKTARWLSIVPIE